jgi:hypothetical protein
MSADNDYAPCSVYLQAIDAKMEELYKTETIMMEMNLSEPESDDIDAVNYTTIISEAKIRRIIPTLSRYPVNVVSITPMADDEEVDDYEY